MTVRSNRNAKVAGYPSNPPTITNPRKKLAISYKRCLECLGSCEGVVFWLTKLCGIKFWQPINLKGGEGLFQTNAICADGLNTCSFSILQQVSHGNSYSLGLVKLIWNFYEQEPNKKAWKTAPLYLFWTLWKGKTCRHWKTQNYENTQLTSLYELLFWNG